MQYVIYQTYVDDHNEVITGDYAYLETLADAMQHLIKASEEECISVCLIENLSGDVIIEHTDEKKLQKVIDKHLINPTDETYNILIDLAEANHEINMSIISKSIPNFWY